MNSCFDSYAAGFFDGEGCVRLYYRTRRSGKYKDSAWCQYSLKITNTNRSLLEDFQKEFGGTIRVTHQSDRHRTCYALEITNRDQVLGTLTRLLPFLRIKRQHAELMIQYLSRRPNTKTTEAERLLCQQMAALNYRGSAVAQ